MKRTRCHTRCCDHFNSKDVDVERWAGLLDQLLNRGQGSGSNALIEALRCITCDAAAPIGGNLGCGHALAVDVHRLELYCLECQDYVYLDQFDDAVVLMSQRLMQKQQQNANATNRLPEGDPGPGVQAKRQRLQAAAGANAAADDPMPNTRQQQQQQQQLKSGNVHSLNAAADGAAAAAGADELAALNSLSGAWEPMTAPDGFPVGLRGLNNLGNTCFMNSVLQVLFHAPLLPAFYLGEGHDPTICRLTARDKPCLSCQMESVFGEVYSGSRAPFSPAEFLYQWWRFADSLAGYQQQDAHEFYLSLLEGLSGSLVPLPGLEAKPASAAAAAAAAAPDKAAAAAAGAEYSPNAAVGTGSASLAMQQQQEQKQQQQQQQGLPFPHGGQTLMQFQQQQQQQAHLRRQQGFLNGQSDFLQQHPFPAGPPGMAAGLPPFRLDVLGGPVGYNMNGWQQLDQQQQQQQQCLGLGPGAAGTGGDMSGIETPASSGATPEPELDGETASQGAAAAGLVELIFSGLLRSDVRCCACGHTSTAHDPFRDISLDLHVPRPPRLPPREPHSRPPAPHPAAAAAVQAVTTPGSQRLALHTGAGGGSSTPAVAAGAAAAIGPFVREPTPPLMLVTPSPTPPASELLVEYWDNDDDTAAGGQAGRLSGLAPATYSQATSASGLTKPVSGVQAGGEDTGMTGVSIEASPEPDGEEVQGRSSMAPAAAATGAGSKAAAANTMGVGAAAAAGEPTGLEALSTGTSMTHERHGSGALTADSSDKSPEISELGGPAASQSSQQLGGLAAAAAAAAAREATPDMDMGAGGVAGKSIGAAEAQDAAAAELASQTDGAAQQQHYADGREATPQSQQPSPLALQQCQPLSVQQQQQDRLVQQRQGALAHISSAPCGAVDGAGGVASSLVRGVSGSLGQLIKAPVAAIKQLLPAWTGGSHDQQQQQQQGSATAAAAGGNGTAPGSAGQAAAAATGAAASSSAAAPQPMEGDGDSMAGLMPDSAMAVDRKDLSQSHLHRPAGSDQHTVHITGQQHLAIGSWGTALQPQDSHGEGAWQQQQHQHQQRQLHLPGQSQQQQLHAGSMAVPGQSPPCQQRQLHMPLGVMSPAGSQGGAAGPGSKGGSKAGGAKTAGAGRASAARAPAPKLPRQQRCGKCKYCMNKHLKKGCEANKKLREEQKQAAMLVKEQERAAAAAAADAAGLPPAALADSTAAAAAAGADAPVPAVPFGSPGSAATQPTHPLAGLAAAPHDQSQQPEPHQHQQYYQQEQQWAALEQQQQQQQQHYEQQYEQGFSMYFQQPQQQGLHGMALYQQHPSLDFYQEQGMGMYVQPGAAYPHQQLKAKQQQKPHKQQQQQQQPLAVKQPKQQQQPQQKRSSAKAAGGLMAQDSYTAAAFNQALMQRRDEKGRFFRKEDLATWARQLHEEGHLTGVDGVPDATPEQVAAARARGRPLPPAYKAAMAAKEAAAAAAAGVVLPPKAGSGAAAGAKAGSKSGAVKKSSAGSGSTAAAKKQGAPPAILRMNELSLAGCLRRFVRPERLGPGAHWRCSACGNTQAALKQMSIRRLPLVLCFHVKRFEHGGGTQRPRKLDVPMRFPLQGLDMAPFTTSEVLRSRAGGSRCSTAAAAAADAGGAEAAAAMPAANNGSIVKAAAIDKEQAPPAAAEAAAAAAGGGGDDDVSFQQQCLYELFGVVSHAGDMSSGHYVSYVKCDGHWYLVNDPWVVAVSEADVGQVQAYMLFYAQEYLFGSGNSGFAASTGGPAAKPEQQQQLPGPAAEPGSGPAAGAVTIKAEPVDVKVEAGAAAMREQQQAAAVKVETPPALKRQPADPEGASAVAGQQEQLSSRTTATAAEPGCVPAASGAALVGNVGLATTLPPLSPVCSPMLGGGDMMLIDTVPQLGATADDDMLGGFLEEQASAAGLDDMPMA